VESNKIENYKIIFLSMLKALITLIGFALVGVGVAALACVGFFVFDIINHPENSNLIKWAQVNLPKDEMVFSFQHGTELSTIKASSTLQYIFYGLFVVVICNGVIAIMRGLINSGVDLIRTALYKF